MFIRQFIKELKSVAEFYTVGLFPFIIGAVFSPLVHYILVDCGVNHNWGAAFIVSSLTFGVVATILLGISGELYDRAGKKAWRADMDSLLAEGEYKSEGWIDSGYLWYAYQVPGLPPVFTRFAPYERKNTPLVVS